MPPPPPPDELANLRCAWLVAGNTVVSCDDLDDPNQPMRCGLLRIFLCTLYSGEKGKTQKSNSSTLPAIWFGRCDASIFASTPFPDGADEAEKIKAIAGKPAYEAIWQTRARCTATTDRGLVKTTGLIFGHVYGLAEDGKFVFLKLTDEFINSEGFLKGRWSPVY